MKESDPPVLILAPAGRDAAVAASILEEAGLRAEVCADLPELVARLAEGSCAVLTEGPCAPPTGTGSPPISPGRSRGRIIPSCCSPCAARRRMPG